MNLQEIAAKRINECRERAKLVYGREFPMPEIEFKEMGRIAGKGSKSKIWLNPILFQENIEEFQTRTIPHEFAHYICFNLYPHNVGHGPKWQAACVNLGMKDITRCHKYDTTNSQIRTHRKFPFFCQCREWNLGVKIVNKIAGGVFYRCPKCKTRINKVELNAGGDCIF